MKLKGKVTIDKQTLYNLMCDSEKLNRLENGGVDNWDWYGESLNSDYDKPYDEWCDELFEELSK